MICPTPLSICRTYCVYLATGEEAIRKHAEAGGFPVTRIDEISCIIDPTTAGSSGGK